MAGAAIVFAVLFLSRPLPLDLSTYKYTPLATDREPESFGAWSPDGKNVAYSKVILGVPQIMVRSLAAPVATQLTDLPVAKDAGAFWSRDGSRVFFQSGGTLWSVGAAGGEPQEVMSTRVIQVATISPDGNTLAFWRQTEEGGKRMATVWISSPPGAPPRKYMPAPFEVTGPLVPDYLRFSPDGSMIGLSIYTGEGPQFWILDWPDGSGAKPRRPFSEKNFYYPPTFDWLLDSRHVVMSLNSSLWLGDTQKGELERFTVSPVGEAAEPSVSPDGRRLLFSEQRVDFDIVEVPLDGSKPRPFLSTSRQEYSPSWSRSGDRMAYITTRSGRDEVWLRSVGGDWERPVVTESDFPDEKTDSLYNAVLSPDGNRLAYNLGQKIWVSPSSGGKPVQAIPSNPGVKYHENGLSWSPDSDSFACNIFVDGISSLAVVRVGSGKPPEFIPTPGRMSTAPAWSHDGRWIAFGAGRLDALDISTAKLRKLADFGWDFNFEIGTNYCLFGSLAPDGRSFVTTRSIATSDLWILDGVALPGRRK